VGDPAPSSTRRRRTWGRVGFGLAFVGVVAWFLVASIALDDGVDDGARSGLLRIASEGAAVAPFTGLTVTRLSLDGDCVDLVVADELDERVAGLRGREVTDPYDGMLFVFDAPTTTAFTMAGVASPLDIAFYDGSGRPVSRARMRPCDEIEAECPAYRADGPFRYALEARAGGIPPGDLTPCPA
jgi:uncharacterized membrane protein (UPF0127 family)